MNNRIYNVTFAALGGATIGVASIVGNIVRLGIISDRLLIPFLFLMFKLKRKSMPIWWPAISACLILTLYKFYLGFFVIAYCLIAKAIYKWGSKIRLTSIIAIATTYIIGHFGVWIFLVYTIYNVQWKNLVYILTGTNFSNPVIIGLILIGEPLAFALIYQYMYELIEKVKLFNE